MLFQHGDFKLSSGNKSTWKIDCNVLSNDDWITLARLIRDRVEFQAVFGVPTGGHKLAAELYHYSQPTKDALPVLIVDDVLTTGASITRLRDQFKYPTVGYVVFARGKCPEDVHALFQLDG